jgi:sugar (pentulose or hexulose) kinase
MGGREFEILSAEIGPVDENAAQAAIGPVIGKGMMLLPNIAPGSGPFPGKASRWIGAEEASREERSAAACLYLALMTDACLGLIGAKGPVIVEGPFALNGTYLKLLAALTGREVMALPGSTGTSQGAALLTGIRPVSGAETHIAPTDIPGLAAYRTRWYAAME